MKRLCVLVPCLFSLLLLSGCANGRALFIFEQPWMSSLGDETRVRFALAAGAVRTGYLPRVVLVSAQERPLDRLLREAGSLGRGAVVVGPLLSQEWQGFASRQPGTRFILVGPVGPEELPPNMLLLSFDLADAFRRAGRAAADAARAAGGGTAVLVSSASELGDAETAAFAAGAAEASGAGAPPVRVLPATPDKAAVQAAIEELRRGGTEVFLLGLGSLDPWALEVLKTAGGSAVVEGWSVSNAFPEQVLLSIEEDVVAGISRALAAAARGERKVDGPVTIVRGMAGSRK